MKRFSVIDEALSGLKVLQREKLGDQRGFFSRLFCQQELEELGWSDSLVQLNHSFTALKGSVRGLHFQHFPYAEKKLVTCLRGEIWDVAVDLRSDSPTFLKWHSVILSSENNKSFLIPEGFAHGFQTLSDDVEMLYCHSAAYSPDFEGGVHPQDPKLDIAWPLEIAELSKRDQMHKMIDSTFKGVSLS